MTQVKRFWPLLIGKHRHEKALSTRNRGRGIFIEAPIAAYLIETSNGRVLYDTGCDFSKIDCPQKRAYYYGNKNLPFDPPDMFEEQRLPYHLARLGLTPSEVDVVVLSHLHFDHAGGLKDVHHAEVHVHARELEAAQACADEAYFPEDFTGPFRWKEMRGDCEFVPGLCAIETPGHTAGHMSLYIEFAHGRPILLCGDAADLRENLEEEVAPGVCWRDDEQLALQSIRKLKHIAREEQAHLWPGHDAEFFATCKRFPDFYW